MSQDIEDTARALATSDQDRKGLTSMINAFEEVRMTLGSGVTGRLCDVV